MQDSRHRILRASIPAALALLGSMVAAARPSAASASLPTSPAAGSAAVWSSTWREDLTRPQADAVNITSAANRISVLNPDFHPSASFDRSGYGLATFAPHLLAEPAGLVIVNLTAAQPAGAEIDLQVRGLRSDGRWGQWTEADATGGVRLRQPAVSVQTRITLLDNAQGASPTVTGLAITAIGAAATATTGGSRPDTASQPAAGESYRVFATDEGLVGRTTANGHVIQPGDHFAALPSTRSLAPNGTTEYSVQICGPAKCETAPVWDVGPWNIHDDYWDPSSQRAEYTDLPQGMPEAQAAYQTGYHGGLDDFGRVVANPAGIDLADGTFADIGLTGSGWVTVTYLWTTVPPPAMPRGGVLGDVTGDGRPDIVAVAPNGDSLLYPNIGGTGTGTFGAPAQVGSGWTGYTVAAVADLYKSGRAGILAITPAGTLSYYANTGSTGTGTFTAPAQVGTGWTGYTIVGLTDLYRTGRPGVLAITPNGTLSYYPNVGGTGTGTFGTPGQVGSGWTGWTADVADINGAGRADLLAIDPTGILYEYPNTGGVGTATFGTRTQVGSGWTGWQAMDTGFLTGAGGADILAIDPTGTLYEYPNTGGVGTATFGTRTRVGSGWTGYTIN